MGWMPSDGDGEGWEEVWMWVACQGNNAAAVLCLLWAWVLSSVAKSWFTWVATLAPRHGNGFLTPPPSSRMIGTLAGSPSMRIHLSTIISPNKT